MRPRLKICCIQDPWELDLAVRAGAHLLGFVGRGLSGPEVIDDDDRIARLAARVPPGVTGTLLTRLADPDALVEQVVRTGVGAVQLCDAVPPEAWAAVRRAAPGVRILQVVHVGGPDALDEARDVAAHVDAVLLDSGAPEAGVFGGSGLTHDWSVSAAIVRALDVPVWLAGGLRAHNVAEAWSTVRPFGLDLCTGVRTGGRLDPDKLAAFASAVREIGD